MVQGRDNCFIINFGISILLLQHMEEPGDSVADPDPACHFYPGPDHACHFYAVPDPTFHIDAEPNSDPTCK
jgi:hypothetical protein